MRLSSRLLLLLAVLVVACRHRDRGGEEARKEVSPFRGPIVVISFDALAAAAVGGPDSATPRLDAFVAEATWAGRGVAAAGWSAGSLASVMTGFPPSVHGATHPAHPWLRLDLPTLAERLAAAGFATQSFYANPWVGPVSGLGRGFAAARPLERRAAERRLAALPEGPTFTWIDLGLPGPSVATAASLGAAIEAGPPPSAGGDDAVPTAPAASRAKRHRGGHRRGGADAAVRHDGAAARHKNAAARQETSAPTLAPHLLGRRARVAAADERFGQLIDWLRRGGRWEHAVVVVLADHGDRVLDGEATPPGLDLGRDSVEVPLAIRVPQRWRARLRAPPGATVGLDRMYATLLELVGVRPQQPAAPSLLRPSAWVATSELWLGNGYHEIALYDDGHQLRWRCRFAPAEPDFDAAWRDALGVGAGGAQPSPSATLATDRYGAIAARMDAAFRARPACAEGEEVALEAWPEGGGAVAVDDPALRDRMLERLRSLRHFPPAFAVGPPPSTPFLDRRAVLGLAGWGLPLPRQWWGGPGGGE